LKKDLEKEKVDEFLKNTDSKFNYEYSLGDEVRDAKEWKVEICQFRQEALQKKFEIAFTGFLEYLYVRRKDDFDIKIDIHKLFENLKLPDVDRITPLKFYVRELKMKIAEMKKDLYNMKINGISRIKIPVSANKEFIDKVKLIYNDHIVVDRLIGDKLRYDQYIFLYDCIKFLYDSSVRDILMNRDELFKEDILPKHVILMALRAQTKIINNLKEVAKNKGEVFSFKDYFQMVELELEGNDSPILNAWDYTPYQIYITPEIKEKMVLYNKEKDKIGRFWMLENFIKPTDKEMWFEALEMLRNINELVIDDIRDYILNIAEISKKEKIEKIQKADKDKDKDKEKENSEKKSMKNQRSIKNLPVVGSKEREKSAKKGIVRGESKGKQDTTSNLSISADSDDEFEFTKKKKEKVVKKENFRPPQVWNFPVDKIKNKDDDPKTYQIRVIDPRGHYIDGRVVKFLDLLQKMKDSMLSYSKNSKGDVWKYFTEKIFVIFNSSNANIINEKD